MMLLNTPKTDRDVVAIESVPYVSLLERKE